MMKRTRVILLLAALLGVEPPAFADGEAVATTEKPVAITDAPATPATVRDGVAVSPSLSFLATCHAQRRAGSISVDGHLGDGAWQSVARNHGFTQRFPKEGAAPNVETEFAVVYDDEALYVAVWANDAEPHRIKGLLTRRDQESSSDSVIVAVDSYHDRRTAFAFGLNPASVQRDMIIFDDSSSDNSWDAVWSGAASVDSKGWTAEFRIPMSQLRFSSQPSQLWGLQVVRAVARTGEEVSWSPWPRSQPQIVSRFGLVDGIENVKPGRRIELLPYATAGVGSRPVDAGDPLNDQVTPEGNFGLDAKYGLSSSFSVAATVNPDFGQVEADPSQVNLGANELFFPEKRPFFLDGVEMFKVGLGQGDENAETLFYSRRIGAAPHGSVDGTYVKSPTSTTIYGATKVSGKTASGWSVGVLDAVTAEERATFIDADGAKRRQVVEPLTNFAVAKLKRDFRDGKTTVSASATSVHRKLSDTGLTDELHDQAYTGGFDVQHRFLDDKMALSAKLLGSYVHGSQEAIAETQQNPRHYFQRPRSGHLTFDPTRTSLSGAALVADIGYRTTHWQGATGADVRTPGLEVNDLGFQNDADQYVQWAFGSYRDNDPGDMFLSYRLNVNSYAGTDLEPRLLTYGGNINGNGQLKNYWRLGGGLEVNIDRWRNGALRGGPSLRQDSALANWLFVESDSREPVSAGINTFLRTSPKSASYRASVGVFAKVQARSNLEVSAEPSLEVSEDDAQYIDQVADQAGTTQYLLGRIRQTSASLTLRVAWTFSPRLSLQAYAQPFLASGHYEDYKEVADPSARAYSARFRVLQPSEYTVGEDNVDVDRDRDGAIDYSFGRPEFGVRELRSTLVVRWEYRPGSSVFAIWSHGQSSSDVDGSFELGRGLSRLGDAEAEDIVMVKANYWIGL
jgi:Domain of unknown function (DUF5916)/Carbohydrate family 9 binding domain-like